ncbi:unnamed protein product [Symbiodinium natans]|uniref:Uncharacterized protein n=1 Tax=Symbiodinium natans TaxID=878477 RepID=A0A812T079_9DINO|nr:unnamed protein product [Symbiodinium natans]
MDECPEMHVGDMGERQPADFDIAEGDLWQDGSLSQAACEDDDTNILKILSDMKKRWLQMIHFMKDPLGHLLKFSLSLHAKHAQDRCSGEFQKETRTRCLAWGWRSSKHGCPTKNRSKSEVLVEADDPSLAEDDAWDVLEEDLGDFVDEEAIKQDLLAEIQTMRDSLELNFAHAPYASALSAVRCQDKELLEEEEEEDATEWEMWQVDEEEFGAVEETAAEAEDQRAQTAAASRPAQSQNAAGVRMMLPSSKKKPMPPSEPPSWYRADAGKADRRDGKELKGTWTSPPQTRVKGGKGKQAKGKANERKRRVEYDGGHAPPLRRKSWPDKSRVVFQAGENWNGHDRSDSDWHGSSRGGRSREGTRHGKSKCDWSQDWTDWKAWRDDGDGEGTALEQKKQEQQKSGRGSPSSSTRVTRGWSWKRR